MSFRTQIILAIIVLVGMVAGITFVSQYQTIKPAGTPKVAAEPSSQPAVTLNFPVKIVEWDPPTAGDFELGFPGHYDFWFENKNAVAVDLGLMHQSCKCSTVTACALTPAEADAFRRGLLEEGVREYGFAHGGVRTLLPSLFLSHETAPEKQQLVPKWQKLDPQMANMMAPTTSLTVPPHSRGILRLTWDGKKNQLGSERLTLSLWTQAHDRSSGRDSPRLEVPVVFHSPVELAPPSQNMDSLSYRDSRTVEFICWSATRASFTLQARPEIPDPCFECSVTPLGADECVLAAEKQKSRILAAYRVKVTAHESVDDSHQLDLGPFSRNIVLTTDASPDRALAVVTGNVRGEITVGAEEDNGKVKLESFPARSGTAKEVFILAQQPDLQLKSVKVEPSSLDYVKVNLKGDGDGRWLLFVKVQPGCPAGKLPADAAAVVSIQNNSSSRQIRIPITGRAYQ
jgi:hypothetical protein